MQFGKIHGFALIVLGIVLLGIQGVFYMTPTKVIGGPTAASQAEHHKVSAFVGLIGLVSVAAGAVIIATANRGDEPSRKNRVK
jgi:hypothetical protein